eukprot:scaffold7232_cov310-Ochromonas_danica.AAC.8
MRLYDVYSRILSKYLSEVVLEVLLLTLKENSLIKIDLQSNVSCAVLIANLLRKHASTIQMLHLSSDLSKGIGCKSGNGSISDVGYLVGCLSLISWRVVGDPEALDCVVAQDVQPCSIEKVRLLYEQCPHLQYVTIDGTIWTNEKSRSVSVAVNGFNEDWAACLCYALRRSQCKQAILRLRGDYYHPVENLKTVLEPYQLRVESSAPESSLIALLQDLPHLNSLRVENNKHDHTLMQRWMLLQRMRRV